MSTINIGGFDYILEQGVDNYWYYRRSYKQGFGKKVLARGDYLMVWNPGKAIISGDDTVGGDGDPLP